MAYPSSVSPTRALRHPAFWACLVLLLVNDHLLKSAFPGALTGKLSDFAGLVVATVLSVALLRPRGAVARALAFALPVAPFVAINVWPAAARAVEASMAALLVPWRIWTDPTDLVALAVLPAAAWLAFVAPARPTPALGKAHRALIDRAGVVVGAIACIATSPPPPTGGTWSTDAFVVNQTGSLDLRIRWVSGTIECDLAQDRVAEVFGRDAFDDGVTFHLEQGDTVPLERAAARQAAGFESTIPDSSSPCDAVLLQSEGMANTVIFWMHDDRFDLDPNLGTNRPGRGAVVLDRIANDDGMPIAALPYEGIVAEPVIEMLEPEECLAGGQGSTFSWSETAQGSGTVRIASLDRGPDGCYAISLSEGGGQPSFFFVCVPAAAFPFEAGDTIEIAHLTTADQRSLRLERAGAGGRPRVELVIYSGVNGVATGPIEGNMVDTECVGDRLDCGSFAVPGAFHATTDDGDAVTIAAGGSATVSVSGSTSTIMVGRVERMVFAHPDCAVGRNTLGIRGDVLVLTEED